MTDFGADESFGKAAKKIKEHYGIEVPTSAARTVTQAHGEAMLQQEPESELGKQGARLVIVGMDGSIGSDRADQNRRKRPRNQG